MVVILTKDVSREILSVLDNLLTRLEEGSMDSIEAASLANRTKAKHLEYWDGEELELEFDLLVSMTTIGRVPKSMIKGFVRSLRKDLDKALNRK